ncbi:FkbM family methyltransferase [Dokdonia sp. Hel_I_53]|uniref:FkbM family methyltransferase n=1 Tax=Dokdonia sp. Hel_I_53 TaxID=1566287 RepID=UPI00119963B3|nr:FkbM family methyltransferase [Dokdonia sp. Hel_I_53]TVZ53383.1 FkbM family methyltransferase [Dokdonia sp. Hel_I_53]
MLSNRIKRKIVNLIKKRFNLTEKSNLQGDLIRRKKIQNHCNIDKILDVGANSGQYALQQLNNMGFKGSIISFEPMQKPFQDLLKFSEQYNSWKVENIGLGLKNKTSVINIAQNSYSSSLLKMLPSHLNNAPESIYVDEETITLNTLTTVFKAHCSLDDNIFLKIDTQGYEYNILESGRDILNNIKMIQIEMSLIPLYEGEKTYDEMIKYLKDLNFQLWSVEPGFYSYETGELLQIDGIFVNTRHIAI